MSHQTGISADESVLAAFAEAKNGATRLMKLVISADSSCVTADSVLSVERDWEADYDGMVVPQVQGIMGRSQDYFSVEKEGAG